MLMEDVATAAVSKPSYSEDGNAISAKERVEKIVPGVCSVCDDWLAHIQIANESRNAYRTDADTFHDPEDGIFYMSGYNAPLASRSKNRCIYLSHNHETFAPLQPTKETIKQWKATTDNNFKQLKPFGVVWREAIQGRFDEDVASSVHKCLHDPLCRQAKHVIIWADNCTGQLKNWTFYSSLVYKVNNQQSVVSNSIKYFEKGQTYMSADSFHARVETAMQQRKYLYDFDDFVRCVAKYGIATEMKGILSTSKVS